MSMSRVMRLAVAVAALALLVVPMPAQSQVGTTMVARFAGTAIVNPSIGLVAVPEEVVATPGGPWRWAFANDPGACNVVGVSGGVPVAGDCNLSAGGPLLADPDFTAINFGKPRCGNSTGVSDSAAFSDPARSWSGEVHWDGIIAGDPSFSIGSWLILFGRMNSDAGSAQVIQFLNATGAPQCNPVTNTTGWPNESRFVINGVQAVIV